MKSGKPTFIEEIVEQMKTVDLDGQAVCVTGRLKEHDVINCLAKLTDPQTKADLHVNTVLIEPFDARFGSLFQMIGELENRGSNSVVLKARVVRCVDGIDMILYRKALEYQRNYLEKRNG